MVFLASFVGFGLVFIAPFVLLGGACLLSALHEKASAPPVCGACGKIAVWGEGQRFAVLESTPSGLDDWARDLRQRMLQSDSRSVRL
jgi:hypothetical protein